MPPPIPTWKLTLSYDGTSFHGWQVQPGRATIQGTLSDALFRIAAERVLPQGSGRTDAGVHALAQVASFSLAAPIPAPNLLRALNRVLPASIRILHAEPAAPTFHARHSALSKTYEYRIFEQKSPAQSPGGPFTDGPIVHEWDNSGAPLMQRSLSNGWESAAAHSATDLICPPFLAPFVCDCRFPLHLEPMQRAAAHLLGAHDFTSFAATDPDLTQRSADIGSQPNPIKTIHTSTVAREDNLLLYRITGSGFLHHMVRNIVGTLIEIGRGSLDPGAIPHILAAHNRSAAGPTAPARGLFLISVDYPSEAPSQQPQPTPPEPAP